MQFLTEINQGFLEKWLIRGLQQEIDKMSLEHLDTPESKKAATDQGHIERSLGPNLQTCPLAKDGQVQLEKASYLQLIETFNYVHIHVSRLSKQRP